MTYTTEIDPLAILEVRPDATLEELRDAYRAKSKKHHPDLGGDEWAFRLVVRSYELLSRARVLGHLAVDAQARPSPTAQPPPVQRPTANPDGAYLRPGAIDEHLEPIRLVEVEILLLRMELNNPTEFLLTSAEQRNLSCCLNLSWPAAEVAAKDHQHALELGIPQRLLQAFDRTLTRTRPISARQEFEEGRFQAWLGYTTAQRANAAFDVLREALAQEHLGVHQWTREIIIPRERN